MEPKVLVQMSANTTREVTTTFDPRTAQALLRSVRRSLRHLEGGVEWALERQRLRTIEHALLQEGVLVPVTRGDRSGTSDG